VNIMTNLSSIIEFYIIDLREIFGIFTFVKCVRILAVVVVIVFMAPLVFSSITNTSDNYVQSEYPAEEERSGERESNTKDRIDDIDEFVLHNKLNLAIIGGNDFAYSARNKEFVNISRDILTPPPKFI